MYPLAKTVANINMDSWNVHGRTRDLTLVGYGASELDDYAARRRGEQGRVVHADAEPEKGFYYRSDHFNFAKQGVPALDPEAGVEYIGQPRGLRPEGAERSGTPSAITRRRTWSCQTGTWTGAHEDLKVLLGGRLPRRPGRRLSAVEAGQRVQGEARRDAERGNERKREMQPRKHESSPRISGFSWLKAYSFGFSW